MPRRVGSWGWPYHEGRSSSDSPKSTGGSVEQTARPGHREDPAANEVLCLLEVDQQEHRRHREEVRRVSTITETARAADAAWVTDTSVADRRHRPVRHTRGHVSTHLWLLLEIPFCLPHRGEDVEWRYHIEDEWGEKRDVMLCQCKCIERYMQLWDGGLGDNETGGRSLLFLSHM